VATARDQAHAVAVALQPKAVAVVFDFVEPVRADRDAGGFGREAEVEGAHGLCPEDKSGRCGFRVQSASAPPVR